MLASESEVLVRKKLIALLSIFALLLAPSLVRAQAADFIDDQFY
jgi:hypothetical protein